MANADSAILTSAILTVGSTSAASMLPKEYGGKGEFPAPRLLFGTAITFAGLSMLGDFAPSIATPLAAAIAMTAMTYYGIPIMDNWFNGKHNVVGKPSTQKGSSD
jgi:hypothetical protein